MQLCVFSKVDGFRRAGRAHPRFATYPLSEFTEDVLLQLAGEPELGLALGRQLTVDQIDAFLAAPEPIVVFCASPGLRRGGCAHPFSWTYEAPEFTEAQLRAIVAEPDIVVVIGRQIGLMDIRAACMERDVAAAEAAALAAKAARALAGDDDGQPAVKKAAKGKAAA